jgi:hypothetical protein
MWNEDAESNFTSVLLHPRIPEVCDDSDKNNSLQKVHTASLHYLMSLPVVSLLPLEMSVGCFRAHIYSSSE